MSRAVAWPVLKAESGIDRHFKEIQRFRMLDPQEEYMLAKRWREDGDRDAADRLVISHLRLVAKIARGYRERAPDRGPCLRKGTEDYEPCRHNRNAGTEADALERIPNGRKYAFRKWRVRWTTMGVN